jgi:flagellar hook-associated protein 2
MATLSSPGVGSGLDVNSIVTQLVAIERQPIDNLAKQTATIQSKLSSFGLLQSYAANIRDIAARLAKPDFWTQTIATSSDAAAISVSSSSTATAGSYAVSVSQLAQAQSLSSKAYADSASVVGSGTLRIEIGAWNAGLTAFTPDAAKTPIDITIAPGEDSLEAIKKKINESAAGVSASIVRDASGAKLVLRSSATGETSAVRVTATDDDGDNADAAGLSALAFDPAGASGQMTQNQAAKNLAATINGLAINSATNKLDGVIEGVTMTVNKVTTSPVDVSVSLDTGSLRKAINDFAKAFTDANAYITKETKYDEATKKAAALQGDRVTLTLQSSLRSLFVDNSMASTAFTRLSDAGLQIQSDGSLKVNDAKLTAALGNPTELAKLFSAASDDPKAQGFAVRVKNLADQMLSTDGTITSRTKGLRESVKRNEERALALEKRVEMTKQRLLKQYTALDVSLNQINGMGSSLTQALKSLTNLSDAIANNK